MPLGKTSRLLAFATRSLIALAAIASLGAAPAAANDLSDYPVRPKTSRSSATASW